MNGETQAAVAKPERFARAGFWVLSAIVMGLLADALFRLTPGPFSIDEITYHLMAKNAAEGRLFIWNGFEELPSRELESLQIRATAGGLSAQYPHGYAWLAAPFIALFGYPGLFLLNALAFLGTALLCQSLATRVLGDARFAALATALWAFAGYAWDYSLAVWPHSVAVLAILATIHLVFSALAAPTEARSFRLLAWAGLVCGFGLTVRLDVALCAGPALAPLLFRGQAGLRLALRFVLGLLPGALLLSALNFAKWGSLVPLSYGSAAHAAVVPWWLAGLAVAAFIAFHQRARLLGVLGRRGAIALTFGAVAVLLLLPGPRRQLLGLLNGVFALVFDAGALPVDPKELAIQRSPSGAVLYAGILKKALLQSCPVLSVTLVTFFALVRARNFRIAWLLAGTPLVYIGFYGASAWHGGMCFNMRYLLPVLPFAAIATSYGLRELSPSRRSFGLCFGIGLTVSLFFGAALLLTRRPPGEVPLLAYPLALAALLAIAALLWLLRSFRTAAEAALLLSGLAAGHAFSVGLFYDTPHSRELRAFNFRTSEQFATYLSDDSLLFAQYPDSVYSLVELRQKVRIALPLRDSFRDFRRLASFHARAGRRVYAAFSPSLWKALLDGRALEGLEVVPIAQIAGFELYELRESERFAGLGAARTAPVAHSPSLSR